MMVNKNKELEEYHKEIKKYCNGCYYYYNQSKFVKMCSILRLYNTTDRDTLIKYIKGCPCNQKCLVKVTCKDVCVSWMEYAEGIRN